MKINRPLRDVEHQPRFAVSQKPRNYINNSLIAIKYNGHDLEIFIRLLYIILNQATTGVFKGYNSLVVMDRSDASNFGIFVENKLAIPALYNNYVRSTIEIVIV